MDTILILIVKALIIIFLVFQILKEHFQLIVLLVQDHINAKNILDGFDNIFLAIIDLTISIIIFQNIIFCIVPIFINLYR